MTMDRTPDEGYVVCVRDDDDLDLIAHKIYRVLADPKAARRGHVRVIDESGEDYPYPEEYFIAMDPPAALSTELRRAS